MSKLENGKELGDDNNLSTAKVDIGLTDEGIAAQADAASKQEEADAAALKNAQQDEKVIEQKDGPVKEAEEKITTTDDPATRTNPEDGEPVSIDDFLNVKNGVDKKADVKAKPTLDKDGKEIPIVEPKVDDKQQPQTKPDNKSAARDYSDFTPEETEILKKTSNEAFNYVRPILLEHKKLGVVIAEKDKTIAQLKTGKQMLPDSYYEHPQAFVLTPDFNTASANLDLAARVQQHWQNQLVNIEKGEDWNDADVDPKTGQLVYSKPLRATIEDKSRIQSYLMHSVNQVHAAQQQIHSLQASFASRHQAAREVLKAAEDKHFAAYNDPKHQMAPVVKSILDNIPAEFRNNPLSSLLAKSGAANIQFGRAVNELKAENAKLKAELKAKGGGTQLSDAQRKAGPNDSTTQGTSSGNGGKGGREIGDNIDDFEAIKNGG